MPPKKKAPSSGASKAAPRRFGPARPNLREQLEGWSRDPEDSNYARFKEIVKDLPLKVRAVQQPRAPLSSNLTDVIKVRESYAYDYAATSTQNRRNLHLSEYTSIVKSVAHEANEDVDDWEDRLWNPQYLQDNLHSYIIFISQALQPRAFESKSIRFNTLVQRRQSMMYWVMQHSDANFSIKNLWQGSNRALHMAFRDFNSTTAPVPKLYASKQDICNLIEFVTYADGNVAMSQQMVIAWLLGFVCGVRPGTIAEAKLRSGQYLRWEDIILKRTPTGNLEAIITFKWLKGWRDERLKPLRFTCTGPSFAEDVMYSIPHRLLALAFRHGYVKDFEDVDELFASSKTKINFKPDIQKRPVICAAKSKGLDIIVNRPAGSQALTNYLQRQAIKFGLSPNVTFYMWRRKAGTNVGRFLGADKARGLLGHEMNAKTSSPRMSKALVTLVAMGVVSMAMQREVEDAQKILENASLSVNRVKQHSTNMAKWTEKYIKNHAEYVEANKLLNEAELASHDDTEYRTVDDQLTEAKRYFNKVVRSLRRQADIAFQRMQLQVVEDDMTSDELQKRQKDSKAPGALQNQLLRAANEARSMVVDPANEDLDYEGLAPDDMQDAMEHTRELEEGEDEEYDRDAQMIRVGGLSGERDHHLEVSTDTRSANDEQTEKTAILAACKLLTQILVGQTDADPSEELECPECLVDETVPVEQPDQNLGREQNAR
ncbi:hypothetical protein DOTSEDRAFT_23880 [Dothistroma septosporum NZE10]|uniref:Uncharacterized protein n=1 Tax=Dothistroma septosporum (strain NZE10 / CBS 128990) TaxID=675120 RepID=N1PK91_DOTSN|nr:hypothetical protein DOTSEDRAFT_23880 [Dothistroma septosporum NZE10]